MTRRATLTAIAALLAAPAAAQEVEPSFFFFGDSSSEQGNASVLEDRDTPFRAPYYCPDGLCRDSNGPIWLEYLGLEVDPVLASDGVWDGLNFSVSGAHMTEEGAPQLPGTGVAAQVGLFEDLVGDGLGVAEDDVFLIHAGPNDFTYGLQDDPPDDPRQIVSNVVGAARSNVERLAEAGARRIMVYEVLPLHLAPDFGGPENAETRAVIETFIGETNVLMRDAVLAADVPDGTQVDVFELDTVVDWVLDNADTLGFEVTDEACYDWETLELCSEDPSVQNSFLFFDSQHLTAPVQAIRASYFRQNVEDAYGIALGGGPEFDFSQPAPVPVPASLPLALGGLGALAWLRRRGR